MTFKKAVKILGGASVVARQFPVARTVINYWCKNGVSKYRQYQADDIIKAAEAKANGR